MSNKILRAGAAGGAVVLSAGTGVATNVLTDRPTWGVGAAVVVLVIAGVALAVATSVQEHRGSPSPQQPVPEPAAPGQSGFSQYAYSAGGRTTVAGRDVHSGMPAGYVVLSLLIVAAMAVGVLLVAVRLAPPSVANPGLVHTSTPAPTPPVDLGYQLTAKARDPRTVDVTAEAAGEPIPGLTYWFFLEVKYHKGYTEYYPRRRMTGRSATFDVMIPPDADTRYLRHGRVYGLNKAQSDQADQKFLRQGVTGVDDYFEKAVGQPVSEAVQLPY